jgi:CBS domain-containing protein
MAAGTRHQAPCCIAVAEVMAQAVVACSPSDSPRSALARMAEHRVRRLPVTDDEGRLIGVLSIADLIQAAAAPDQASDVAVKDVITALQAICRRTEAAEEAPAARASARRHTREPATAGHHSSRT